ncbi:MAG: cell envelope integrity protein TolA [Elusimicrobia bacterium]|nr:cell envelope integrity protein TolA [Candidatus Obscuribacterium magneticum]
MRKYLLSSAAAHIAFASAILFLPIFNRANNYLFIDGFDYFGGGAGGGGGGGLTKTQRGQIVPQPVKVPLPPKPAPIQKATKGEEEWRLRGEKTKAPPAKEPAPETFIERGEKTQKEQSNVVSRGVGTGETAGEGSYDFGEGPGIGPGVGVGMGDGSGFGPPGFRSYLRIIRQRIWSEWTQVYGSNQRCIVGMTILKSGDVIDIKLEKSSGDSFYDTVALRAVRNAAPLPPLPAGLTRNEQRFRIQFRLID